MTNELDDSVVRKFRITAADKSNCLFQLDSWITYQQIRRTTKWILRMSKENGIMPKIYLLKERLDPDTEESFDPGPFEPWYDKMFACVVIAKSEKEARKIASESDEATDSSWHDEEIGAAWLDEKYTTCEVVTSKTHKGLIIADVHWD